MAKENGPFEDVFPIENENFHCYVSLPKGNGIFHGPLFKFNHQRRVGIWISSAKSTPAGIFSLAKPREMPCHSAHSKDNLRRPGETYW